MLQNKASSNISLMVDLLFIGDIGLQDNKWNIYPEKK
jgi:hypothetical protein